MAQIKEPKGSGRTFRLYLKRGTVVHNAKQGYRELSKANPTAPAIAPVAAINPREIELIRATLVQAEKSGFTEQSSTEILKEIKNGLGRGAI